MHAQNSSTWLTTAQQRPPESLHTVPKTCRNTALTQTYFRSGTAGLWNTHQLLLLWISYISECLRRLLSRSRLPHLYFHYRSSVCCISLLCVSLFISHYSTCHSRGPVLLCFVHSPWKTNVALATKSALSCGSKIFLKLWSQRKKWTLKHFCLCVVKVKDSSSHRWICSDTHLTVFGKDMIVSIHTSLD